jgi:hypothetical protein
MRINSVKLPAKVEKQPIKRERRMSLTLKKLAKLAEKAAKPLMADMAKEEPEAARAAARLLHPEDLRSMRRPGAKAIKMVRRVAMVQQSSKEKVSHLTFSFSTIYGGVAQ